MMQSGDNVRSDDKLRYINMFYHDIFIDNKKKNQSFYFYYLNNRKFYKIKHFLN